MIPRKMSGRERVESKVERMQLGRWLYDTTPGWSLKIPVVIVQFFSAMQSECAFAISIVEDSAAEGAGAGKKFGTLHCPSGQNMKKAIFAYREVSFNPLRPNCLGD
jgi:hypothetical protein